MGGAIEKYKYNPDIVTYAKSLGNGFPVAAYGGKSRIMDILGEGVSQGGTYCGNNIATAAALATLDVMEKELVHERIDYLGRRLKRGLSSILNHKGIPHTISSMDSIFSFSLGITKNLDARSWARSCQLQYEKIMLAALKKGVLFDMDPREPICICYSHTEKDIDDTLNVLEGIINSI